MNSIEIIIYSTKTGKEPFSEWKDRLDTPVKLIIAKRLNRVRLGNLGDFKKIQGANSIWELRIDHGSGYRIYFGKEGATLILLLIGGNKQTQERDITKAKKYWLEYKGKL